MKNKFNNKIAWIVGASSGIGKALALYLNEIGCKIIISSRNTDLLNEVINFANVKENISILPLDLLDFNNLDKKTYEAFSIHKRIDYIFLNGGTSSRGLVSETLFDVQKSLMNLNYFSYVKLTQAILPFFYKQQSGYFIVTSSVMGKIGTPYRSAYAASKHALHGFFDCLRAEISKANIKVTVLTPGYISTNISFNTLTSDGTPKREKNPIHEKGLSPEEAAKQIIKVISKNKREAYIGKKLSKEYFALVLFKLCPNFVHKVVTKIAE